MILKLIFLIILLVCLYFVLKNIREVSAAKAMEEKAAKQTTLKELNIHIGKLMEGGMNNEFFGITSNSTDCIYFAYLDGKIKITYEQTSLQHRPYAKKFQDFAKAQNYPLVESSYNSKDNYGNHTEIPVYEIAIDPDKDKAAELGSAIMTKVFRKSATTIFQIVP